MKNINLNNASKAFSLAEMMVVMLILSIVMAASMPIITKRTRATQTIPSGVIVMWSGTVANIPPGWHLCDNTLLADGTRLPDLRNRFVVGAGRDNGSGTAYTAGTDGIGTTGYYYIKQHDGGQDTHTLQPAEMPPHNHNMIGGFNGGPLNWLGGYSQYAVPCVTNGGHWTTNLWDQGDYAAHENRPPFYALAYIIKL